MNSLYKINYNYKYLADKSGKIFNKITIFSIDNNSLNLKFILYKISKYEYEYKNINSLKNSTIYNIKINNIKRVYSDV